MEFPNAAQLIASTAGRFFACEFIKKDGSLRRMVARTGVTRYVTGAGLKYNPAEHGLAVVWDLGVRGYRMVNLNTLLSLRCGSLQWSTLSEQPQTIADGQLRQELAELEERRIYFEARKESADRGYSRRFSSLNAQTYRHKLARIQERQIEIRAQIATLEEDLNRAA